MSIGAVGAAHAAPDVAKLKSVHLTKIFNTIPDDGNAVVHVFSGLRLNGKVVYCIDLGRNNDNGDSYAEAASVSGPTDAEKTAAEAARPILEHGFGLVDLDDLLRAAGVNTDGLSKEDQEIAAIAGTQTAIWNTVAPTKFSLLTTQPDENQIDAIVKSVADYKFGPDGKRTFDLKWWKPQFAAIQKVYLYLTKGKWASASLAIAPADASGKVGSKVGPFTVKSSGVGDADLTASTGGILVDKDGKPVTKLADGGQFFVDCKAEGTVTIDAKAKLKAASVAVWHGWSNADKVGKINSDRQTVVMPVEKELVAHATANCTAAPVGLPVTGAPVIGMIVAGVTLLLTGVGLFFIRRRRQVRFTA